MTTPSRRRPLCLEPVEDRVLLSLFQPVAPFPRPEPSLDAPPAERRVAPRPGGAFEPAHGIDRGGFGGGPPVGHQVRLDGWEHGPPPFRVEETITIVRL